LWFLIGSDAASPNGLAFFVCDKITGEKLFKDMIHLTKATTQTVYLTLKEKQTLSAPNYLFRFVHRATNAEVKFVKLNASDSSTYKDRYNAFSIVVNTHFANSESGQYDYYIYEQTSTSNTNPANATGIVETGVMQLAESTSFAYTKHNPSNTFIVR